MFTGLIECTVQLLQREPLGAAGSGAVLRLSVPQLGPGQVPWEPVLGESIAISGCCLTLARLGPGGELEFELSRETLEVTWLDDLREGQRVNLERSVRLADRMGGHMVSGHVDAVGQVVEIRDSGDQGRDFVFEVPAGFERYLVPKGSVTIDGISLTVVKPEGRRFQVAVIPETLQRTSLGSAAVGDRVHLEADLIGKWVERLLAYRSE